MVNPDRPPESTAHTLVALAFTCADCRQRFTRLVRGDPTLVSRCFGCEYHVVWRTSQRLLEQVFGPPPS